LILVSFFFYNFTIKINKFYQNLMKIKLLKFFKYNLIFLIYIYIINNKMIRNSFVLSFKQITSKIKQDINVIDDQQPIYLNFS